MARSKTKRGKHHVWIERTYEYLKECEEVIPAVELPQVVQQKNGRPFRNPPLRKGVATILNRDKRFEVDMIKGKAYVKRRDD